MTIRSLITDRSKTKTFRKSTAARLLMAVLPVAFFSSAAMAANLTWDSGGSHPTAPVNGSGNWDTLTAFWSNGTTDGVWDNVSTAVFGTATGAAGTVTIDDASGTVTAAGLTFNAAASGNYVIAASGADTLTLSGLNPIISVATGVNATISAPITGAFGSYANGATATGLVIKGLGTLTLTGNNTYTGSTIIENNGAGSTGTSVVLSGGGSLGTAAANVYVGFNPTPAATDTSSLTVNGSTLTASSLVVNFNFGKGAVSTAAGSTVNVQGSSTINANTITIDAGLANGNTKGGDGSLILASGATLALHDAANDGGALTLLDIANYVYESGGATGTGIVGTVDFSAGAVNGNITTINIATGKAGSGVGGAGTAVGSLLFGNGSLTAGTINIARFGAQPASGTLSLIAGGTGTITAGTGTGSSAITFGATGQGTQGSGSSATGVINIAGGTLNLNGDMLNNPAASIRVSTATINLTGGTLNMQGNNIGPSGSAITLVAFAGTLENVASINNGTGNVALEGLTTSGNISQVLILTGTNSYAGATTIGGDTVIANGAASMGAGGALAVNNGTLDLDGFSQGVGGLSGTGAGAIITNNGVASPVTLTLNGGTGNYAGIIQNGTSSVALHLTNNSSVTFTSTAAQTYTGATNINSGSSLVIANINSTTAVTADGAFTAAGTVGSLLVDQGGSITPGAPVSGGTTGILNASSLSIGSGGASMNFLATTATSFDQLLLTGSATFNGLLTINATISSSLAAGNYTLVSAPGGGINISDVIAGNITVGGGGTTRLAASLHETSTLIQLVVNGGAANLVWTDGATSKNWENTQGDANWHRTDAGTAGLSNQFYNGDNVTFDSTNNLDAKPNYSVNISAPVLPGSVLFTNGSSTNYTLSSTNSNGIGGAGNLTVSSSDGTGIVTLNTVNTYTGNTTVTAGTLVIGPSGSVAGANFSVAGGATATVNAGGSLTTPILNVSGAFNIAGTVGGTTLTFASPAVATVNSGGNLNTTTVNVNGGSLTIQSGGNLNSTNLTVASGASFTAASGAVLAATLNLTDNGTAVISDPTINTLNGTNGTATLTLNANNLAVNASGSFAGQILDGGSGGSFTVNAGTQILTGVNNYNGATTINTGATLQLDAGANTGSLSSATAITDNGTFIYARTDSPSFSNVLSGAGAFQAVGGGVVTLTGNNSSFSGTIQAYAGTIVQNDVNSFGVGSGFVLGTLEVAGAGTTTPTGNITLTGSVPSTTVASISSTSGNLTAAPAASVLTVPAGVTLTDSGTITVGSNVAVTNNVFSTLAVAGGGSLVVNGNATISQTGSIATLDLSGLNSTSFTGTINIGNGAGPAGTLTLANTTVAGIAPTNTINTPTLSLATTATNNPSGTSTLNLGSGTNTIQAGAINLGTGRGSGVIQFIAGAPSTASVTISDQGGGGGEAIILANTNTNGTFAGTGSFLNLAGFNANVQAASLLIAQNAGNLAGGAIAGVTFDTGTFTVNGAVTLAADTSGSSTTGPTANLTIGGSTPNNTATGNFTANGGVILGNFTNANAFTVASAIATATFTINGGIVNINGSITNNSTQGTTVSTLNLSGGTLNLNGNSIGGSGGVNSGTGPITVNLANGSVSATLENLGGGGINGVGIDVNGTNTLILDGSNTYSGSTSVNAGATLSVAADSALPSTTDVIVNGVLKLNNPSQAINSLNGTGTAITLNTTALTVNGTGAFSGTISDNGTHGAVIIAGTQVTDGISVGSLTINGALQIHSDGTSTGTSKVNTLVLGSPGTLDLTNNKLIVEDSTTHAATLAAIKSAVAAGAPTNPGIFSSTLTSKQAIAVVNNAIAGKTTFGGDTVDAGSILVVATFKGDANLDGVVNIADLNIVAANWQKSVTDWSQGDFNSDGIVNIADLNIVAANWQAGTGSGSGSGDAGDSLASLPNLAVPSSVPEPASLAFLGLGGLFLAGRRRRSI